MCSLYLFVSCVVILSISLTSFGDVSKDVGMTKFYKELGCKLKPAGSKDPLSYECPSLTLSTENTCVVRGKTYKLGDPINAEPGVCLAGCVCLNQHKAKRAKVVCANVECPEHLGVPVRKQCSRTYNIDKCCATGLICDAATKNSTANKNAPGDVDKETVIYKSTPTFTCNVGGVKYEEHSKYYPAELPCSRCVCMKGHDGTNKSPWCADIPCSLELRHSKDLQDGCAPVFIKFSKCCPLQFRCPKSDDKVIITSTTNQDTKKVQKVDVKTAKDIKQGPQCTFGALKLNIGDKVSPAANDAATECICLIPPFVTCSRSTL